MNDLALRGREPIVLIGAALAGAAVAVSLGVYGRLHTPTGLAIEPITPDRMLLAKSILTSVAAALALFQLASAAALYGRLARAGSWFENRQRLATAHRWSGMVAFLASLPVAYHCLWSLGFQSTSGRVVFHSFIGCAFYGAFATKLLLIRSNRVPTWALPVAGAAVVTLIVALWFSSALWFFTGSL